MKTIVIFSHGFGVRKDAYGLFDDIDNLIKGLGVHDTVMFDYSQYNEETKELTTTSFSQQAHKLQAIIDETYQKYPNSKIVIIGHSQGCTIPTLCDLTHVNSVIMLAPFFHTDMKDVLARYTKNIDSELNFTGVSKRYRSDGSITLIPPEYRKERFDTDIIQLYNDLALDKELYIIYGLQDQVMKFTEHHRIKNSYIINIDSNHDFNKQYRPGLIKILTHIFQSFIVR